MDRFEETYSRKQVVCLTSDSKSVSSAPTLGQPWVNLYMYMHVRIYKYTYNYNHIYNIYIHMVSGPARAYLLAMYRNPAKDRKYPNRRKW